MVCRLAKKHLGLYCYDWHHLSVSSSLGSLLYGSPQRTVSESFLWREHLLVGAVADKDCADCHAKHLHEHIHDEVRQDKYHKQRPDEAVDFRRRLVAQCQVAKEGGEQRNKGLQQKGIRICVRTDIYLQALCRPCPFFTHLAQEEDKVAHHADRHHAKHIPGDQKESTATGLTERVAIDGRLDVGVLVEEAHALLDAPHTTLQHTQHA